MRIQLSQAEIEVALRDYISNQGFNLSNKQVTVSFTNTRSPASTLADIDIEEAGAVKVQAPNIPPLREVETVAEAEPDVDEDAGEKKSLFG